MVYLFGDFLLSYCAIIYDPVFYIFKNKKNIRICQWCGVYFLLAAALTAFGAGKNNPKIGQGMRAAHFFKEVNRLKPKILDQETATTKSTNWQNKNYVRPFLIIGFVKLFELFSPSAVGEDFSKEDLT